MSHRLFHPQGPRAGHILNSEIEAKNVRVRPKQNRVDLFFADLGPGLRRRRSIRDLDLFNDRGNLRVRRHYSKWVLWGACLLLIAANAMNIAADLKGMADVTRMIMGISALAWIPLYSAYAISEAAAWRDSLEKTPQGAKKFNGVLTAAMVIGLVIDYLGLDAVKMLFWSAVVNGVLAPPLILLILLLTSNSEGWVTEPILPPRRCSVGRHSESWPPQPAS